MQADSRPRCVVLGLDGLPYSLACELGASGRFPNLGSLTRSGNCFSIRAELPELSPVNWTSFFTGAGPEKHGIYGFTRLDPQTYRISLADSGDVKTETIFDRLGRQGLVSRVINLPNTYPARPLKGMLVSGFPALDLEQAVYPRFLLPRLEAEGYRLEADTHKGKEDFRFLLSELQLTLESRARAVELFWPDLSWDLFVLVLTETDRLGHFLFPALSDPDDPWHEPCLKLLEHWDRLIGAVLCRWQELPDPKRLLVLADHGFTGLKTEVDLNAWLRQQGLLSLEKEARHELDCEPLSPGTKAFALDPGRIYVHSRRRFARGLLSPDQVLNLKEDLKAGLRRLCFDEAPVLEEVLDGDRLYPGADDPQQPDLVCVPGPGFDLKAKFDRKDVFGFFGRRGTHTPGDAFCYDSQGARIETVRQAGQRVEKFFQNYRSA
ncbi:MAG: alkaline phosphatase family protein [Desulfohalobiaceae bacterium]|nr:alkaline phosphatase family protein [Desulfohalobiaceae bacterium]